MSVTATAIRVSPAGEAGGIGTAPSAPSPREAATARAGAGSLLLAATVLGIVLLAVGLRGWDMQAAYSSGDQTVMPYLVRHSYGWRWIFAHAYGPVCPLVHRCAAELVTQVGLPLHETIERFPVFLLGLAHVVITFALLRRLHRGKYEALAGALCCALTPTLVADARLTWAWGYLTIWVLTGTIALWAALAYLDERRPVHLWIAAGALLLHCLSNVYAFALPATLILLWVRSLRSGGKRAGLLLGFLVPCVMALTVIVACWRWTGQGQIGHLLAKQRMGTAGWHWDQLLRLPGMWAEQFGYLFGIVAAAGLGCYTLAGWRSWKRRPAVRRLNETPETHYKLSILSYHAFSNPKDRRGLLVLWAWLGMLPVLLLADWDRIGYPAAYFMELAYPAGLLGTMLLFDLGRRFKSRSVPRYLVIGAGVLAFAHLGLASAHDGLGTGRLAAWTGVHNEPVEMKADIGAKAAGWYVREHVPMQAIVLSVHTNKGMESSVAEIYLGRCTLAGFDHRPTMIAPLLEATVSDADVILVNPDQRHLVDDLFAFECVCTIRYAGQPVRFVYARPELRLPRVDEEADVLNRLYDARYVVRHVPVPLEQPPGYLARLGRYQNAERILKKREHDLRDRGEPRSQ